ncbi:Abortive phage resistance protein AbiGi [Spirosomataceae bacterium]|jgi:hypothetical protein
MQLSSNCLFHFTNSIEKIIEILKSESFIPSYCKEKNWFESNNEIYVPQVSFCDVPLSNTSKIQSYGEYAIGLSMDWANRNSLNPTFYLNTNSNIVRNFSTISKLVNSINGSTPEKEAKRRLLRQLIGMYNPETEKSNLSNTPSLVKEVLNASVINFLQNTKE